MQLKRMALVAGMTAAATAGLASQAWAAPADTSVSERQCFDGDGRVQREADGVGTCVGGTNDGLLIDDDGDDRTGDADDISSSRSDADADSDSDDSTGDGTGYGRDRSDDTDATGRADRSDSDDADDDRSARRDSDDDTSSRSSGPAAAYRF